jgi:microcystin-dependent protein
MSEPFVAEIRIFAGNFAPRGWAFCNGQLLPIAQNTALFSLQGRAPMHPGRGPDLTDRRLGETGGVETVTLSEAQMSNHTHTMRATSETADLNSPASNRTLARSSGGFAYQQSPTSLADMAPEALPNTGNGQPHNNMQPFLTLNFIIALVGLFP